MHHVSHSLSGVFRIYPQFQSRFLPARHDLLVYVPRIYDTDQNRRFPVFYLHDGQNVFDGATSYSGQEWGVDETAEFLIGSGAIEPLIIVGINNAGDDRIEEYTPTRDRRIGKGGKAKLYGRMLIEEVKRFIDSEYRTLPGPANTGLGGSSLGGLVSLHLGLTHPEVFGKLAVISPSVWWDDRLILRRVLSLDSKPKLRIWLDIGTGEGERVTEDARLLCEALMEKGWELGVDLAYEEAHGAGHNEDAWADRVPPLLKFLFPAARP
ncbi:MAG: alpha/beta hydrolase [Bryobacteraceae bacterium]